MSQTDCDSFTLAISMVVLVVAVHVVCRTVNRRGNRAVAEADDHGWGTLRGTRLLELVAFLFERGGCSATGLAVRSYGKL